VPKRGASPAVSSARRRLWPHCGISLFWFSGRSAVVMFIAAKVDATLRRTSVKVKGRRATTPGDRRWWCVSSVGPASGRPRISAAAG